MPVPVVEADPEPEADPELDADPELKAEPELDVTGGHVVELVLTVTTPVWPGGTCTREPPSQLCIYLERLTLPQRHERVLFGRKKTYEYSEGR